MKFEIRKFGFFISALVCLHPFVSSAMGLILGLTIALVFGNPFLKESKLWSTRLLQLSVMGLGGAMDFRVVAEAGKSGIGYTAVGITLTLLLGVLLGRLFKTSRDSTVLISSGTAICGGSAIAAVAPVIGANAADISVSLVTVFLLNAIALLIFPGIGHFFGLSEQQFGMWAALAIHDTSSVVGASMIYGTQALELATIVKLARALWIVPLAAGIGFWYAKKGQNLGKIKKPWFILGFLIIAALVTWVPDLRASGEWIAHRARRVLVLTLFLIGSSLDRATLKTVGIKPLLLGITLWMIVGVSSLLGVYYFLS